jgi:hypothetical protein
MDKPQQESPRESKLAKKLAEVMGEVHRIPKRGRNDFHNYDFATESDIADAVRAGLASRGVMILPQVNGFEVRDVVRETAKGKKTACLTFVNMTFTLKDAETGEAEDRLWVGCGEDSGDKGIYKAITGATKYFLLKLFVMSTGDDPERDGRKKDKKAARPEPHPHVPGTIDAEQQSALIKAVEATGMPTSEAKALIKRVAGVDSSRLIPVEKFAAVLAAVSNVGITK